MVTLPDDQVEERRRAARRVSVLIPFKEGDDWTLECVQRCQALDGGDAEVDLWLLPDGELDPVWRKRLDELPHHRPVHVHPTGSANPAAKRNRGMEASEAEVFALVDADAWPRTDWLTRALPLLNDGVEAVAGPNLTPEDDPVVRRAPGRVMASPLGFGAAYIRHTLQHRHDVREMPTCNMVIRRIEGMIFNERLDTGEDMTYCADLRARGGRILYDPEVVVYHHRRRWGASFSRQFYHYGLDKGRMARKGSDGTYPWQVLPSLLVFYLATLPVLTILLPPHWRWYVFMPLAVYASAVLFETLRLSRSPVEWIPVASAFVLGHIAYGWGTIKGFLHPHQHKPIP